MVTWFSGARENRHRVLKTVTGANIEWSDIADLKIAESETAQRSGGEPDD
jgi:hypothetical protein